MKCTIPSKIDAGLLLSHKVYKYLMIAKQINVEPAIGNSPTIYYKRKGLMPTCSRLKAQQT